MHISEESGLSTELAERLRGNDSRKLSDQDRDSLMAMLDADNEPNEKLIEAFNAMKQLIAE